jgi:hypothetical protein
MMPPIKGCIKRRNKFSQRNMRMSKDNANVCPQFKEIVDTIAMRNLFKVAYIHESLLRNPYAKSYVPKLKLCHEKEGVSPQNT